MNTRLVINGIDVEVVDELPISCNFSIADVREPANRNGSITKSIKLYGTSLVNTLFENIFEVNLSLSTYNPNKVAPAFYYINGIEVFKGDLQLLKINKQPNGFIEYECNILGREGGLFLGIGEKFLTDLDLSSFDHVYNRANQKSTWTAPIGVGYMYPMINYGNTGSDSIFSTNYFKPAVYVKEYWDRIFADAGYTYTSTFLSNTLFKRLIIPCNKDKIELTPTQIKNSQYYIGKTTSTQNYPSTVVNTNGESTFNQSYTNYLYNNEAPNYYDTSAQYDSTVTYWGTVANSGVYNVVAKANETFLVTATGFPVGTWEIIYLNFTLQIEFSTNGGSTWFQMAATNVTPTGTYALGSGHTFNCSTQTGNIYISAGTKIRVNMAWNSDFKLRDNLSVLLPITTATNTARTSNAGADTELYLIRTDTSVAAGNTIVMNNTIPPNIKQKDFVKSIMQMFNLYFELDKDNDTNLIIEPRDSFYTGTTNDWTGKVDYKKPFSILPMGELNFRSYVLKYKDDKDHYNSEYIKAWTDNYGLKRFEIDNDFLKNVKVNELIFSPTPLVGTVVNDMVYPKIYAKDTNGVKPLGHNIRILYFAGVKNINNPWTYQAPELGTSFFETQYPYAGHLDNPQNPTLDLNFKHPNEVYYTFINAVYTQNGLFNTYHYRWTNEVTDKDSKIVRCWVRLNENDINQFTFREKVFIDGTYYVVNKIIDYNPLRYESTQVELLKLKDADAFVNVNLNIDTAIDG